MTDTKQQSATGVAKPTPIEFGKHKGLTVWQCPEHYLRWLIGQKGRTEHFRQLQREAQNPLHCIDDAEQQAGCNDLRWDGQ